MIKGRNNNFFYLLILVICVSCDYNPYSNGKEWYDAYCASCHGVNGNGFEELYPPLEGIISTDYPLGNIACYVRYGKNTGTVFNQITYDTPMPAYPEITNTNLVNLINYMNYEWGDKRTITEEEVKSKLAECKPKVE